MSADTTVPEDVNEIFTEALDTDPTTFRVFIAAINTSGELVYKDQTSENGPFAAGFSVLSTLEFDESPLQASTTTDGYVSVLAQQSGTQHLIYIAENKAETPGARFDNPVDLGIPASVSAFRDIELINGLNGLPNVFGASSNTDGSIWWKYMNPYTVKTVTEKVTPPGTDTPIEVTVNVPVPPAEPWSDWIQIPGGLVSIEAAQNADGRVILGGINANGQAYINFQSSDHPDAPEGWKGWQEISQEIGKVDQLELAIGGNSLVHIFARVGSNVYMKIQTETSEDAFTDWVLFAAFDEPVAAMTVSVQFNKGLYFAAQVGSGKNSPIYSALQLYIANYNMYLWTQPSIIAYAESDSEYVLQPNANTSLMMIARSTGSNTLSYTYELTPDMWRVGWTEIGDDIVSVGVTEDVTVSPVAG